MQSPKGLTVMETMLQEVLGTVWKSLLLQVTLEQLKSSGIYITNGQDSEVQLTFGLLIFTST